MYPGLHFAKALSLWHIENDSKPVKKSAKGATADAAASTFLTDTILQYPLTTVLLLEKLGARVPDTLAGLPNAQAESGFSR